MRSSLAIVLCALLGLLVGCADRERYYAMAYEALRKREAIVHPSPEREPGEKPMSYQEYQAARKKRLERNGEK